MNLDKQSDLLRSISRLTKLNLTLQNISKGLEHKCGLSIVQWSLLKTLLEMPAVSPQVLAKAIKVTPGTLSQSLSRLEKKKFLFMCDDPADARRKMISLTRSGKDALEVAEQNYLYVFSEIESIEMSIQKIDDFLTKQASNRISLNADLLESPSTC